MAVFQGFIGPAYQSQNANATSERLMNLYLEKNETPGAKAPWVLNPTPGVTAYTTLAQSPNRGLFAQDGRAWAVGGNRLYEVFAGATPTDRGLVARDSNPATFASSGDTGGQLFVTSGDRGYILDLSTHVLTQVVLDVTFGAYVDGYFLGLDTTESVLRMSNLLDGTTWSATNTIPRDTAGDKWKAMVVAHGDIWLVGSETTDVFYNAGTSPVPFAPIPGAFIEMGTCAPFSVVVFDGTPAWIAQGARGRGIVVRANGYGAPTRISTHAIEYALQSYSTIDDAIGFTYEEYGHTFYVLNFPTAGATWVYDASTEQWHERGWWDGAVGTFTTYRPQFHAAAFGTHLVGDRSSGVVYEMKSSLSTDVDGTGIRRVRRAPHISDQQQWMFYAHLHIDMQTGLGLSTGQGSDPTVMLRYSNDGGRTFGNERTVSAGALGRYAARARFTRLGRARDRVFEVSFSDPVPFRLTAAYLDVTKGLS
ncbi:MAG TPA: hypothetical protein VNJ04_12050 [Gemmatimonadaceae bacterium]|nr:hypothetical protein [Gemmatimonadaceae bacterium]